MDTIWTQCLRALETKVGEHATSTWLKPIEFEQISDGKAYLSVPNSFFISWIRDNYLGIIRDSLSELTGNAYELVFRSRDDPLMEHDELGDTEGAICRISDSGTFFTEEFAVKHNLNPRYTFNTFVVGECNRFADAAARSVVDNLGKNYNPLFIYGGVGLGKTHLMSAIGYAVLSKDTSKKISFVTSEEFTNEMINAIRFDKTVEFRNKYRKVDLLLIDDIQFMARKERTQEEFFHTFNRLYENGNQIVITSDRVPTEMDDIEQRLKSRFNWGLVADLGVPDLETRIAILKKKASEDSINLPDDVAFLLAEHVNSNVRELVGYLVRVLAMSTLQGLPLTKELAQVALKDLVERSSKTVTVDEIIDKVAKAFNVKSADIKSKKKHKQFARPRQVAMYLARKLTDFSYPEIGAGFGGKDHSTVIYATRKIEKTLETDHSLKNMVTGLIKDLKG